MQRVYEIFEVLPNGLPHRVTEVAGLEPAKSHLQELANHTANECFAADAQTYRIVAQTNVPLGGTARRARHRMSLRSGILP